MRTVDQEWQRLVDALEGLGTVTATDRGLAVVTESRTVEIVMTARDWSGMPTVYGYYPINEVLGQVSHQPEGVRFLVYNDQYELEPCVTPFIPPDPDDLRLEELRRNYPKGIPGARWVAYRPDQSKKGT